ncbi:19947_t:CDS:2 [Funneliformis geosporum]|nr:19947_t:CDS:2 [Funneliformis geosporum]
MEKDAKLDVKNTELKSKVRELEIRLVILKQNVTKVNGQSQNKQNNKEVIASVLAVDISESVIDQQNDINTKSIEDKEIGDFISEKPANISDSVIAQPKQCKPLQIKEVVKESIPKELSAESAMSCEYHNSMFLPNSISSKHIPDVQVDANLSSGFLAHLFDKAEKTGIEIDKVRVVTLSADVISRLTDIQIQNIINFYTTKSQKLIGVNNYLHINKSNKIRLPISILSEDPEEKQKHIIGLVLERFPSLSLSDSSEHGFNEFRKVGDSNRRPKLRALSSSTV